MLVDASEFLADFPKFSGPGGRFGRAKMGRGINNSEKIKSYKLTCLTSQVRCADLPPAGRTIQKNHLFEFFAKSQKIDQNKKYEF